MHYNLVSLLQHFHRYLFEHVCYHFILFSNYSTKIKKKKENKNPNVWNRHKWIIIIRKILWEIQCHRIFEIVVQRGAIRFRKSFHHTDREWLRERKEGEREKTNALSTKRKTVSQSSDASIYISLFSTSCLATYSPPSTEYHCSRYIYETKQTIYFFVILFFVGLHQILML